MASDSPFEGPLRRVSREYIARNPRSMEIAQRASAVFPGGTTRTTTFFAPYPPVLRAGAGAEIVDSDGNRRVDYLNNYTSLILGHAHPEVLSRAREVASSGTAFSSPTEHELHLAEVLVNRVESVEQIRFTNSGTEATMAAMRLARAFTDRPIVARCEGSFHGTHDYTAVPAAGIPDPINQLMVTLPYNSISDSEKLIDHAGSSLAAVIVEPVLGAGGTIPADREYLDFLRTKTAEMGALLIFDEVITFRLGWGGAGASYEVIPDLTTFGKIIGGGFPIGAFGGREDVMSLLHPTKGTIAWGGTFNGNPVSAVAGIATLETLTAEVIDDLNGKGDQLRDRLNQVLRSSPLPARVTGIGSLFNIWALDEEIKDNRAIRRADPVLAELLHLGLMNRGFFLAPRGMGCLSTPMTSAHLNGLVEALEDLIDQL
ncbi:MAG: aspartate aminotransferase family protein [bacterium]|nr:aspartate aminotransferase family protein [bacterium]